MIDRLAIFGATGDLTARYLLPGLAALRAGGHLGDRFELVCAGREDWDSAQFRNWAAAQLDRHGGAWPTSARQVITAAARWQRADAAERRVRVALRASAARRSLLRALRAPVDPRDVQCLQVRT